MTRFVSRRAVLAGAATVVATSALPFLSGCDAPGTGSASSGGSFKGVDITGASYAKGLQLKDFNGQVRSLAEFKGKVVVVNLWAMWCAPCRTEYCPQGPVSATGKFVTRKPPNRRPDNQTCRAIVTFKILTAIIAAP